MDVQKELGKEVDLTLEVKEGKIIVAVAYDGKGADAKVEVALEGDYFIDKLTEAIPGELDDMVGAALKGALK